MTNLAPVIRAILKNRRVSQRRLAEASGISRSTIKRLLAGETATQLHHVEKLLETLGYSLVTLETGMPSPKLARKPRLPKREPTVSRLIKAAGCHRRG
jgi:transcriptional regulator with XRE-family HTH domain